MNEDRTEYQTAGGRSVSKKLSTDATTPPAEVPGYRLQRFLGSGAFGQVWVGLDLNTGRGVAVKFYLHRGGVNWALLSREVKNLVQLSADRHVVQVLEVGWDSDPPYYVMELVTGGSLEDLLQQRKQLPLHEAVELFHKICIGLNHCHGKGVLHCDLKPANILLGDDNEPRLADFGQSRMSHDQTPTLGTLFYMAPEQADLEATPDASWDVYAAGAILFRMLTGLPPYRDDSVVDQVDTAGSLPKRLSRYRQAIAESPPPTEQLSGKGIDRALQRIVARCLSLDPNERYANAQQILQALARRNQARTRRPLVLLGIVGPLLLLAATCFFAVRGIQKVSVDTQAALQQEAFGSNQLAARFAARTLESELERYFDLARRESSTEEFIQTLSQTFSDPVVSELLQEIANAETPAAALDLAPQREKLLDAPARNRLDEFLQSRLSRYTKVAAGSRQPRLATIFVTDAYGTIVGIAYEKAVERSQNSAGRNYSYRTYYHGGSEDLDRSTPIDSIAPLRETHLSAAFPSTATGLWKVAVSTPVYFDPKSTRPDAVFVATINLGDFKLLQSEKGANQVAVLVDARQGDNRGTILQHPLMDIRRDAGIVMAGQKFQMKPELMDRLIEKGMVDYKDPVAQADDGRDYGGDWIAAIQPVALPINPNVDQVAIEDAKATNLLVLVQYRLETVLAPVGHLRTSLLWLGAAAVGSILLLTVALWWMVTRAGVTKAPLVQRERTPSGDTETMTV